MYEEVVQDYNEKIYVADYSFLNFFYVYYSIRSKLLWQNVNSSICDILCKSINIVLNIVLIYSKFDNKNQHLTCSHAVLSGCVYPLSSVFSAVVQ